MVIELKLISIIFLGVALFLRPDVYFGEKLCLLVLVKNKIINKQDKYRI